MNKDELTKWVLEERLSLRDVARLSGKSLGSVRHWCRKYDIVSTHKSSKKPQSKDSFECPHHGPTAWVEDSVGRLRCKQCRVDACTNRRKRVKQELIAYKGGCCELCSYNKCREALEFHHKDPSKKDFGVGSKYNWAMHKLKTEVDKCALLCANCHREVHAGVTALVM